MIHRSGQPIHRVIARRVAVITEQRARQEPRRWINQLHNQAHLSAAAKQNAPSTPPATTPTRADRGRRLGQLSPEQRTAFAAYWHREHDTTGPTTHPIIGSLTPTRTQQQAEPEPAPHPYTATTTGHQVPATGPPAKAAAKVFAKPPPTLAETTAARRLAAASFPHQEPTSISATGQIRTDPLNRAKDDGARDRTYDRRYPTSEHGAER